MAAIDRMKGVLALCQAPDGFNPKRRVRLAVLPRVPCQPNSKPCPFSQQLLTQHFSLQ